ncbi:MAG: DNA polymerase III subunit gamma/tau [Verrucomicrobia subdivision 3 bacterium]|nr:DNA polymerase III subunit gamma/tau [Limisphaerales bacterium]
MSYQVIARKYRPQRFSEVVGQEHVTQTLGNAIASGRIAHAYLFSGPRGTGKTTIARIFAKCLNATDGPTVDFKDNDERCMEITEGRALDVLEIDGASNNGVEQVRELRDTAPYAPASCRFKVYIIDEVHMLSTAAFNALLKTLEEPPAHVKFIFATTEPEKVLPTILSRCQRFDLRRISVAKIVEHLAHIAEQEKVTIEPAALEAIARGADGGMRDAESTLDQLISFCGETIAESDVLSMFGLTSQTQIISLAEAILKGEAEPALRELSELTSGGKELRRLVGDLLNHFRNLMVFQVSKGDVALLEISEAEQSALAAQAKLADATAASRILEVFAECEFQLRSATSRKILVEVSIMKAIDAASAMSLNDVLDHLQQLRAEGGTALAPVPSAKSPAPKQAAKPKLEKPAVAKQEAAPMPTAEATVEAPAIESAPVPTGSSALWAELLGCLGPFVKGNFAEAHLDSVESGVLSIGFPPGQENAMELANNPKTLKALKAKMAELGQDVREVRLVAASTPADWVAPVPAPVVQEEMREEATPQPSQTPAAESSPTNPPKPKMAERPVDLNEFKNDPLIKKALEVFKGQIVDVRT